MQQTVFLSTIYWNQLFGLENFVKQKHDTVIITIQFQSKTINNNITLLFSPNLSDVAFSQQFDSDVRTQSKLHFRKD